MYKALVKANNDLLSFCECKQPEFATTGQAECPWCGCGWMFSCSKCRKAYVFAKVVSSKSSPLEIARREYFKFFDEQPDDEDVLAEAQWLSSELQDIPIGTECIIIDGKIISVEAKDIEFSGWFAKHAFSIAPQVAAIGSKATILSTLGTVEYWLDRELSEADKP